MKNLLEIKGISKKYADFELDNVSFNVPKGTIVGFIGRNGTGKSTTIKSILNIIQIDKGEIDIFGVKHNMLSNADKEKIGVVFDESCFPIKMSAKQLGSVFNLTYKTWDKNTYEKYINKFNLPMNNPIESFSRGMKMKFQIVVCLSHNTELFILDEATSGLDPIVKTEILNILRNEVIEKKSSILMSSHILSDIENLCDYIAFIDKGKLLLFEEKDKLIEEYAIIKCSNEKLLDIDSSAIVGKNSNAYGNEILVKNKQVSDVFEKEKATLEEIMIFMLKETNK